MDTRRRSRGNRTLRRRSTLAWFDEEHLCLLASQRTAAARGWYDVVCQLAWVLATYTYRRGHLPHRVALWEMALGVVDHLDDA
ncbi:MAG: hypothetical protein ACRDTG_06365, partial [Pseudonocardiaceae bacterium]